MSVTSVERGFAESCIRSHEFLRRACTYTPESVAWAGDLILTTGAVLKQSEVNDMRGEAGSATFTHVPPTEECSEVTVGMPGGYSAEETSIRSGSAKTFNYTIPKNPDPENEANWDIGILQSNDDCGVMMDGGDILYRPESTGQIASFCGTVVRRGVFEPVAHYLDNRKSYTADPDRGLLIAMSIGEAWEIRYSTAEQSLAGGLVNSTDVSEAFNTAITALGMTQADVISFGMI